MLQNQTTFLGLCISTDVILVLFVLYPPAAQNIFRSVVKDYVLAITSN